MAVVAEKLEPDSLFSWFVNQRNRLGLEVIPLGRNATRHITAALRRNVLVALLSDRDITGGGVEVLFFGEKTRLPKGPALLALRTRAPLIPTAVYMRPDGGHHGVIRPPLKVERQGALGDDVRRVTQALAFELEELIRAAPSQWHIFQPNWPSDLKHTANGRFERLDP